MISKSSTKIISCITLLFTILLLSGCSNEEKAVKPTVKLITSSVYASVTVEPDSMYEVHAAVSGIIADILIKEGDKVNSGQPIVSIDNASVKLSLDNARLALKLANENLYGTGSPLKSLKNQIASAQLNYTQDSIDYMRQKRLWDQSVGTEKQYDQSKLAYEVSRQTLSALKREYSRTRIELETAVKNAKNNLENARIGKNDFTISSRLNGRVYQIFKEPGELISPQEPLATIGKSDAFIINMLVDEVDITKIKEGQKVLVNLDAFGEEIFEAIIKRILPQKDKRTQTFLAEAVFLDPPSNLYSGLSGEANIVISKKEALVIPRRFLLEDNKVKTDEGLIPVKTGVANMEYVEIVSGIDSLTSIFLP